MRLREILLNLIIAFSLIGLGISIYQTYAHYDTNPHEICSINESFDCDIVNKSQYSKIAGIPVAVLGIGGYGFFLIAALWYRKERNAQLIDVMGAAGIAGFLFSLYLTYIEAFVLYTWCIFCIISAISMTIIFVSVLLLRHHDQPKSTPAAIHES